MRAIAATSVFETLGAALEQPLATLQDVFSESPRLMSRLLELLGPQLKKHLLRPVCAASEPRRSHRHMHAASEPCAFSFKVLVPSPLPQGLPGGLDLIAFHQGWELVRRIEQYYDQHRQL